MTLSFPPAQPGQTTFTVNVHIVPPDTFASGSTGTTFPIQVPAKSADAAVLSVVEKLDNSASETLVVRNDEHYHVVGAELRANSVFIVSLAPAP